MPRACAAPRDSERRSGPIDPGPVCLPFLDRLGQNGHQGRTALPRALSEGLAHRTMEHLIIEPTAKLPAWSFSSPYLAVLWVLEGVTGQWQREVSEWLIDTGCLYTLVWTGGVGGNSWAESLNEAGNRAISLGKVPVTHSIIAECHEFVALKEVLKIAEHETVHPVVGRLPSVLIIVKN